MEREAATIAASGYPITISLGGLIAIDKSKVHMPGLYCGSEFVMKNERAFRIGQGLVFTAPNTVPHTDVLAVRRAQRQLHGQQ
eukprot:1771692-Pyramimonas_sp.AAC.1